jgi:hypothetical protein
LSVAKVFMINIYRLHGWKLKFGFGN